MSDSLEWFLVLVMFSMWLCGLVTGITWGKWLARRKR